jgi:hypothetical protein
MDRRREPSRGDFRQTKCEVRPISDKKQWSWGRPESEREMIKKEKKKKEIKKQYLKK